MESEKEPFLSPQNRKDTGSTINRFVGFDEDQKREAEAVFRENFQEPSARVLEKSDPVPEQVAELAEKVQEYMSEFLSKYGIDEPFFIPGKNFRVLKEKAKNHEAGFFDPFDQHIFLYQSEADAASLVSQAHTLVHEILHTQAFRSMENQGANTRGTYTVVEPIGESKWKEFVIGQRRGGFSIQRKDSSESYFRYLSEAIIEELTQRFHLSYFLHIPELHVEEQQRRDAVQKFASTEESRKFWLKEGSVIREDETTGKLFTYEGSYFDERKALRELVDILYQEHPEQFASSEEVFNLFVQGEMTGNILPIARLVEKTFGKGAFRSIGEQSQDFMNPKIEE